MTQSHGRQFEQHPLSAEFPPMPDEDFEKLVEDIRKHGQREAAILFEGMVLDGWHRYRACQQAERPFRHEDYAGQDAVSFVISKNLHRRHLTGSQRAAIIVASAQWAPTGIHIDRWGEATSPHENGPTLTNTQMAAAAGVSERTIQHAKRAEIAGLGQAVRAGKVTAAKAAEVAKLPEGSRTKATEQCSISRQGHVEREQRDPSQASHISDEPTTPDARIAELEHENSELRERIAELSTNLHDMQEEIESMSRVLEANDPVTAALAEVQRVREFNRTLEERVRCLQVEKNDAIRHLKAARASLKALQSTEQVD